VKVLLLTAALLLTGCSQPATLCDALVASYPTQYKGPCFTPAPRTDFERWKVENERKWKAAHPDGEIAAPYQLPDGRIVEPYGGRK